ncbi:unnamed protein product [Urochloa humidicola]
MESVVGLASVTVFFPNLNHFHPIHLLQSSTPDRVVSQHTYWQPPKVAPRSSLLAGSDERLPQNHPETHRWAPPRRGLPRSAAATPPRRGAAGNGTGWCCHHCSPRTCRLLLREFTILCPALDDEGLGIASALPEDPKK